MKEILDSEIESIPRETHSRRACQFFAANLVCVFIIQAVGFLFDSIQPDSDTTCYNITMIIVLCFIAFGILGFRYSILSIIKKEKWTYIKIVGLIGNLLFFALIILLFAANVNDVLKG